MTRTADRRRPTVRQIRAGIAAPIVSPVRLSRLTATGRVIVDPIRVAP